jgi:hypothetical protein
MTTFLNNNITDIDAMIAAKNAEMEAFRLELEKLKAEKSKLVRVQRVKQEEERKQEAQNKFKRDFEREKSNMTMPTLHKNGFLENPVIRTQSEVDEVNEAWSDADDIREFGDIMDTSQHRHYGFTFVNGIYNVNTQRSHDMVLDQEYGVTVPYEICEYLTDSVGSYKKIEDEACICVYELPFYDVTVQKYKVEPDNLYEYRRDEDFGDEWDLYVIYHDGSERKASLKK